MSDELASDAEVIFPTEVTVRSAAKREVDMRLAPFDVPIESTNGPEVITRGSFAGINADDILLMGLEHEVHLGIDHVGNVIPTRRPMGRAIHLEEREDGAYATFRVAKTASGDEFLALAEDKVYRGVSIEMGKQARTRIERRNGRRWTFVDFTDTKAVAPTYHPAYADAQVLAVRAQKEDAPVATEDQAPADGATEGTSTNESANGTIVTSTNYSPAVTRMSFDPTEGLNNLESGLQKIVNTFGDKLGDRITKLEEQARSSFDIPGAPSDKPKASLGQWMETALQILSGSRVPDQQFRVVQELITTDNAGVVPDAFSDRIIGVIDPARPFMSTTERIPTPDSGMSLVVPKITQRPTVDLQQAEKDELASQKTIIGTESFNVKTYGGVGDLSLQLLKRSDPSFLELYLRLLAEAYAIETEDAAVASLITAVNDGGPEPATALNPASLNLGSAFQASFSAIRKGPDTIWLSSEAVAEFIDAKATGTNAPLYSNLSANFTAAGGVGGTISGLRAVHVPALDDKGAYAIVGPSTGFAWAEDGTYTLQVDVPSKAGRDVALVGMVWHVPWYPEAFSLFNVAS